jgi:hypothetical protein
VVFRARIVIFFLKRPNNEMPNVLGVRNGVMVYYMFCFVHIDKKIMQTAQILGLLVRYKG